jgi:outer membrane protein assembly factor BamB
MKFKQLRAAVLIALAISASGCGIFKKGHPKTPVLGQRIDVLTAEADVKVDPATAAAPMALPAPVTNTEWAQAGGNANHSMGNLALAASPAQAWVVSAGLGSTVKERLSAGPRIAEGKVFTMDTAGTVHAFDAQTGASLWRSSFGYERGEQTAMFGGGLAYAGGRVYAVNGLGFVAAIDASTGKLLWQVQPGGPLRGSPTVAGDALYVLSQDNQIYSLKLEDGSTNWSQAASLEIAGIYGTPAPAFAQGTVVAGFSSGELNAYRYENGRIVWQDVLAPTSIRTTVASLSDINAEPVVDNGQVIAIGAGGRMVAMELVSGQRMWENNLPGLSTPAVAGDWIFVVASDGRLVCLARATGKVRWITQLPAYRKAKNKSGPITYVGPILAGNRLILGGSNGALIFVDPTTGAFEWQAALKAGISVSPAVANSTLYVLDDNGYLHAFR